MANPPPSTPEQRYARARALLAVFVPAELIVILYAVLGGHLYGWILAAIFAPAVGIAVADVMRRRREQHKKHDFPT
jgi:Flp pilus assembly protein TadB